MRIKTAGPDVPAVEIKDADWALDSGRYIATVSIAGCLMHLEAFPVTTQEVRGIGGDGHYFYDHHQEFPKDWDDPLGAIYVAVGADGDWATTTVRGVECVLVATPFCD
jgi:hypothetical protein